jgi:hypothetical protein
MFAVKRSRSLLYCFHICVLSNEMFNFFKVDIMPPIAEEDSI